MKTRRLVVGLGLSAALVLGALPAMAQQIEATASPEAGQLPVTTDSGRPDLYLDMPYYLGGLEPEIVMTRGEEHFGNLAPGDPTRLELEGLLQRVGAETEDLVSGYALVSQEDLFSFVVAIRVEGVEPGSLLPAYLPILEGDLEDPLIEAARLGGRDVLVIRTVGAEGEPAELYVYDEGDTIWLLQGPIDVVEVALGNLPEPLAVAGEPEAAELEQGGDGA